MISELKVQFNKRISLTPCDVYSEPNGPTLSIVSCGDGGDAFTTGTYKIENGCPPFELLVEETG